MDAQSPTQSESCSNNIYIMLQKLLQSEQKKITLY